MKLTPNITLSTGRIITHAFMANGAQSANVLGDESATMTEAEKVFAIHQLPTFDLATIAAAL